MPNKVIKTSRVLPFAEVYMNNKERSRVRAQGSGGLGGEGEQMAGASPGGTRKPQGLPPSANIPPPIPERGVEREGVVPLTPLKFKVSLYPGRKSLLCPKSTQEIQCR